MRYKYTDNDTEATELYFDSETNGEYWGVEQDSTMKKVSGDVVKSAVQGLIEDYNYVKQDDVYNGLDSTRTVVPLSANKGRELNEKIETNEENISTNATNLSAEVTRATGAESTNATNIASNATDIATNTDNIATNTDNIADLQAQIDGKRYGIDIDETTGDVTRLYDAVSMTIGSPDGTQAITSDFDNVSIWSDIRHVKVSDDGVIKEQFEHDYDAFDGEIMTYIPQFYYKDWRENDHRYCVISNKALNGYSKAWQDKEYGLCASFLVSYDTDYHSEIAGAPKTNTSYTNFIDGFYAKGDGNWSMYDSNMLHNLFLLTCIEGGSANHKGMYGRGINSGMPYSSSDSYKVVTATTDANTVILDSLGQPFLCWYASSNWHNLY